MISKAEKKSKFQEWKEKRKEKRKEWEEKHPEAAKGLLTAKCVLGFLGFSGLLFYSGWTLCKDKHMSDYIFDETKYELDNATRRYQGGPQDYVDEDGTFHQDIGYGCYAVWPNREAYLNAEKERLDNMS